MTLYRNWPEICEVGRRNPLLMLVLASITIDEDDANFIGLYTGFPQCFTGVKTDNTFPLSIIRSLAEEKCLNAGQGKIGADYPEAYGVLEELGVPYISFNVFPEDGKMDSVESWPIFPMCLEAVHANLKQGDVYEFQGSKLVILECNCNPEKNDWWHIHLAPQECIALDL